MKYTPIQIDQNITIMQCGPTYNDTLAANDIDSVSFNNIVNLAIIDLASIGITNIKDMLTIDETVDGFDVICTILKNSIDKFEYLSPMSIHIYPYYQSGQRYRFIDNFWEFLEGKVDRSNLQVIPRHIVAVIGTYLGTLRGLRYEPPYLTNITYTGQFDTLVIFNRPYKMERKGDRFTEDSRYYFIGELYKENLTRFRMLFKLNLCEYIIRLNENLEHPNLPINTFQGLTNYTSQLRSEYEELLQASKSYYTIYADQ